MVKPMKPQMKKATRARRPKIMKLDLEDVADDAISSGVSMAEVKKGGPRRNMKTEMEGGRVGKYTTAMADPILPASHPLVDVGNLQYGQDFIRGMGYGMMLAKHM